MALGPVIDERQRDKIHALVTGTVDAGGRLAAGGTYDGLFYKPTVLADVAPAMPAYANEVFGPVAPVVRFSTVEEAAKLAADSEYGLSLGILTKDVMRGLDLARKIPTGIVHINDQTVDDAPNAPFGGVLELRHRHQVRRLGQPGGVHRDALGDRAGRHRALPVLVLVVVKLPTELSWRSARARRSASSAPARPACCCRTCWRGAASTRWSSSCAAGPTARPGSGPGCWSRAAPTCCARPGSAPGWTPRAWSTAASTSSSAGSGTTSTSAT